MGRDKGLIMSGKKVWAEVVREKFVDLSIPSVLSINCLQKVNYLPYFDENDLVVDNPNINIQGPVLGLLSTHLKFPTEDLFVLACDMISMNALVLRKLYGEYQISKPSAIAFKGDRVEPMCAIYSSQGLDNILRAHQRGALSKNSMTNVLDQLDATHISILDEWRLFFENYNNAEDGKESKS